MSELKPVRLLVHLSEEPGHRYAEIAAPLIRHLESTGGFQVEVGRHLRTIAGHQAVLAASDRTLEDGEVDTVARHLAAGGGLLLLHSTLEAWARNPRFAEIAGWSPGRPGPETELVIRPAAGSPVTDRLDPEFLVEDELYLGDRPPPDATVLLTSPWHHTDRVVAFSRPIGAGRLVYLGLGNGAAAYTNPAFRQVVFRCARHAAGLESAPPMGVGLYGYGAIGREHAGSVESVAGLELRGVCDRAPERRDAARSAFGVATYAQAADMLADPAVDLVVVGVPPPAHASAVLEAVAAGKHVVCEKPFALRVEEVDRMIAAARTGGRLLTVYQSRRWDPDYVKLRETVQSGAIGELFYVESFIGGYGHPCSFWHSHEAISGGTIYDWGSHYFDWVLRLFDDRVAAVSAVAQKRVWHDVTNSDQVRVDVTFEGGRQAMFVQSDISAALKPKWYLLGTRGAVTADWRLESVKARDWTGDLMEEPLAPSESPSLLMVHRPDGQGGVHREELALPRRVANGFYRNLADHLLLGEPLTVRPEEARRSVAVMEAAARSIAAGGRQLQVSI